MNTQAQKKKILQKLNRSGAVSNFWAVHNGILRLGARILDLKKEGYGFLGIYNPNKKKGNDKNYHYFLIKTP